MFTFLGSPSSVIFPISTTNANSNKKLLHVNHTTKTHEIFRMNLEYPQKDYTATRNDIHRRIARCERRARIRCYAPRSPRKHHANALDGVVRWCKTTADVCKRDCTVIRAYIQMDVMFWELQSDSSAKSQRENAHYAIDMLSYTARFIARAQTAPSCRTHLQITQHYYSDTSCLQIHGYSDRGFYRIT
jgi:hypothetical protein